MESTTVVFIHGAGGSIEWSNYIRNREFMHNYDTLSLAYNTEDGFYFNLSKMLSSCLALKGRVFFVAHSLGGLYALHLASRLGSKVEGGITLATPYGGSEAAEMLNLIAPCKLFQEIGKYSKPVKDGKKIHLRCPWTVVVTTSGRVPWITGENDGVVSKKSMMDCNTAKFIAVPSTHNEVILNNEAMWIIESALEEVL